MAIGTRAVVLLATIVCELFFGALSVQRGQEVRLYELSALEFQNKWLNFVESDDKSNPKVQMLQKYIEMHNEAPISEEELSDYVKWVELYTRNTDIDPVWVLAIMWQESRLQKEAVSNHSAIGLMQMLPGTAKAYGISETALFNPETSIKAGILYLTDLQKQFNGDLKMATIAYNQGITNVKRGKYRTWYLKEVNEHYETMYSILNEIR